MTQPKEKGGVPPIEIYTIVKPVKPDPVTEQDSKNEDDGAASSCREHRNPDFWKVNV